MFKRLLDDWPLAQQILHRRDGTGLEARSARTRALSPKNRGAQVARSVCPYCAVGCGQLVYHRNGTLASIEGDPESPVSRGRLCPKGSNSFELLTHAGRQTRVKYRKPYATRWETLDLETAMDMIADRVWDTRERTFVEQRDGQALPEKVGGSTTPETLPQNPRHRPRHAGEKQRELPAAFAQPAVSHWNGRPAPSGELAAKG